MHTHLRIEECSWFFLTIPFITNLPQPLSFNLASIWQSSRLDAVYEPVFFDFKILIVSIFLSFLSSVIKDFVTCNLKTSITKKPVASGLSFAFFFFLNCAVVKLNFPTLCVCLCIY